MNKDIEKFWERLKTTRDELRLRAHLAGRELKDEIEVLEVKWQEAEKNIHQLQDNAIETTAELRESAHIVMEEISSSYERIKDRLKNQGGTG